MIIFKKHKEILFGDELKSKFENTFKRLRNYYKEIKPRIVFALN